MQDVLPQGLQFIERLENNIGAFAIRIDSSPQAILELMGFAAKLDRDVSGSATIASEAVTTIRTVSSLTIMKSVLTRYTAKLDHANSRLVRPMFSIMVRFTLTVI